MEYPVIGKEFICVLKKDNIECKKRTDSYGYATVEGLVLFANVHRSNLMKYVVSIQGSGRSIEGSEDFVPKKALYKAIKIVKGKGVELTKDIVNSYIKESENFEYITEVIKELDKFWIIDILNMGIL